MGFFGNLFKGEAKKFVSNVVGNIANELSGFDDSNDGYDEISREREAAKQKEQNEQNLRSRLESVLVNEYGDFELRRNVPASELGAEYGAVNYSYGLYKGGEPKAFMMVITDRNDYRLKPYRLSKSAAEARNIAYMNFFSHLPNETDYISERLRKNIFG